MKKKYNQAGLLLARFGLLAVIGYGAVRSAPLMATAQEAKLTVRGSGLPVPRFVSLKFNKANLRAGPGSEYPVLWQYRQVGLPLLVDAARRNPKYRRFVIAVHDKLKTLRYQRRDVDCFRKNDLGCPELNGWLS